MDFRVIGKSYRYGVRVTAIIIRDGKLLTYKVDGQNHLVGGAIKVGEATADAIVREVKEELGLSCEVKSLMYIVENRFDYQGELHHMVEFHYLVDFHGQVPTHTCDQEGFECQWLELDKLSNFDLRPKFLKDQLKHWSGQEVHVELPYEKN